MERCGKCSQRQHEECEAVRLYAYAWCECPCHTGELVDPIGRFVADLAVVYDDRIEPVSEDVDYKDPR